MKVNAIRSRSGTLDSLRGLTLFSRIAYHLCWDLVYLRGLPWVVRYNLPLYLPHQPVLYAVLALLPTIYCKEVIPCPIN